LAATSEFGFPTDELDPDDRSESQRVVMLGRPPNRIDLLTRPEGIEWVGAEERRVASKGASSVFVLSRTDLIAAKRAAGRPRDLADVAAGTAGDGTLTPIGTSDEGLPSRSPAHPE